MTDVYEIISMMDFDKTFIIDDISQKSYSYNKFFAITLKLADYIDEHIEGDSLIAIKENSFELVLLYFAVMFTQKKIMVIDPQKGEDEIATIISLISPTYIYLDADYELKETYKHVCNEMPDIREDSSDTSLIRKVILERLKARKKNSPYLVTFTSGTSGVTKGVEHTLENLFLTAIALDDKVQKRNGTFLHVMPMTYMAGILNSLIYPFIVGTKIVITKRFSIASARKFWDKTIKYGVDLFWLSPAMLMMIEKMDRKNDGEQYCKNHNLTMLIGTAPLTSALRTKFNQRYGVEVFASYGLSETLFISVETRESLKKANDSVGELLDGVDYKLTNLGEMLINVPWMFLRYTNEDTNSYFVGEYYKTGDLVKVEDKCLYITGRKKDLIIKGGMNISPVLIEECVYKEESVLENVIFDVKDGLGEERICCAYTLKNGCRENEKNVIETNIMNYVMKKLGKNYLIDYFWNLQDIPRNINGKIDKSKLRLMWETRNEQ